MKGFLCYALVSSTFVKQYSKDSAQGKAFVNAINAHRSQYKFYNSTKVPIVTWNQNLANCAHKSMSMPEGQVPKPGTAYYDFKGRLHCYVQGAFGTITKGIKNGITAQQATAMINGMVEAERKRCEDEKCCLVSKTKGEIAHYTQILWATSVQVGCGSGASGTQCWWALQGNIGANNPKKNNRFEINLCQSPNSGKGKLWTK